MNITEEKIDDLNAIIRIELNPDDYNPGIDKQLREYSRKINMPGFRPGKVPAGIVKKMYGKSALLDEINRITSDSLLNYIREHQLNILGNPLPKAENDKVFDAENPGEIKLAFEVGISPEVSPDISSNHSFNLYLVKTDDDYIQEIITDYQKRLGKEEEIEISGPDDIIHGEFRELDQDGNIPEEGIRSHADISSSLLKNKEDFSLFTGISKGQEIKIDLHSLFRDEQVIASLFRNKIKDISDLKSSFVFIVESVKKIVPAELDQEFFDRLFGKDKVHNETELKERLREDTRKRYRRDSEARLFNEAVDFLVKNTHFNLPDDFMKRWLISNSEGNVEPADIEQNYENYAKGIRWQLIEAKIMRDHQISFKREDVLNRLTNNFLDYMGMSDTDNEEMRGRAREIATNMLKNEKEVKKIYEELNTEALTHVFLTSFDIRQVELPFEKWVEQLNSPMN